MSLDLGTLAEPNLAAISEKLRQGIELNLLSPALLEPEYMQDLQPAQGKFYFANTLLPVTFYGQIYGNAKVILLRPEDGTGKEETFNLFNPDSINIPRAYRFSQNPEKVLPRSKEGTLAEVFLPLGSINLANQRVHWGANSLELLSVNRSERVPRLVTRAYLGSEPEEYVEAIRNGGVLKTAQPQLTTGFTRIGTRFGNPHAVFYAPLGGLDNVIQIAAFLAVDTSDPENPLARVLDQYQPATLE